MSGFDQLFTKMLHDDDEKEKLLARPDALDNVVSDIASQWAPTLAKPSTKFARKIDAVDAAIPSGHSMKGFAQDLDLSVKKALKDPRLSMHSADEIIQEITKRKLAPRIEGAYKYKRAADASWFGLGGEDETVRKLPGHDEWLKEKREEEDKEKDGLLASPTDLMVAAGLGAAGGAWSGGPVGAAGGAIGLAGVEMLSHPFRSMIQRSEWYRSKADSTSWLDKAKTFTADVIPDLAIMGGLTKAIPRVAERGMKTLAAKSLVNPERYMGIMKEADVAGEMLARSKGHPLDVINFYKKYKGAKELDDFVSGSLETASKGQMFDVFNEMQRGASVPGSTLASMFEREAVPEHLALPAPPGRPTFRPAGPRRTPSGLDETVKPNVSPGVGPEYLDTTPPIKPGPKPSYPRIAARQAMARKAFQELPDDAAEWVLNKPTSIVDSTLEAADIETVRKRIANVEAEQLKASRLAEQESIKASAGRAQEKTDFRSRLFSNELKRISAGHAEAEVAGAKISKRISDSFNEFSPEKIKNNIQGRAEREMKGILGESGQPVKSYDDWLDHLNSEAEKVLTVTVKEPGSLSGAIREKGTAEGYQIKSLAENIHDLGVESEFKHGKKAFGEAVEKEFNSLPAGDKDKFAVRLAEIRDEANNMLGKDESAAKKWLTEQVAELRKPKDLSEELIGNGKLGIVKQKEVTKVMLEDPENVEWMAKKQAEKEAAEAAASKVEVPKVSEQVLKDAGLSEYEITNIHKQNPELAANASKGYKWFQGDFQPVTDEVLKKIKDRTPVLEDNYFSKLNSWLNTHKKGDELVANSFISDAPHMTYDQVKARLNSKLLDRKESIKQAERQNALWRASQPTAEQRLADIDLRKLGNWILNKGKPGMSMEADFLAPGSKAMTYEKALEVYGALHKRQRANTAAKLGVAGLFVAGAASLGSMFSPSEAEAGIIPELTKKGLGIMKEVIDAGLSAPVVQKGVKAFGSEWKFQEQVRLLTPETEKEIGSHVNTLKRTAPLPLRVDKLMSPHGIGQAFYKSGLKQMLDPSVQLASARQAVEKNVENARRIVQNVLDDVPGYLGGMKKSVREVRDVMSPLAKKYSADVGALRTVESELQAQGQVLQGFKRYAGKHPDKVRKVGKAMAETEERIKRLELARQELAPVGEQFAAEWETTVKPLAQKHAGVRMALAAEDTADHQFYPWLDGMLSYEEKGAVAYMKNLNETFANRMTASGHKAIESRPFMHHAWHPDWSRDAAAERLKLLNVDAVKGTPYTRFFQRSKHSVPMMPEISYIMEKYIPDAENRLQMSIFWDKKSKYSWYAHSRSDAVQASPALRDFWQRLRDASIPAPATTGNTWANRYVAFEVARLIGGAPSVALKHFFKVAGTVSNLGLTTSAKVAPQAAASTFRTWARNSADYGILNKLGVTAKFEKHKAVDEYVQSFVQNNRRLQNILDFELNDFAKKSPQYMQAFDSMLGKLNEKGSALVATVEMFDRAMSVLAATEMAAKQGMTGRQAAYGIMDTTLKNNFMSGMLNPGWMKEPKIRAMLLFQNTPYKIWERRMTNAVKTGKGVIASGKVIAKQDVPETLRQLKELGGYIRGGEQELKGNLIADALTSEKDFFGTPVAKQVMRETLLLGSVLMAGGYAGLNFHSQSLHVPFFKLDRRDPALTTSPIVSGFFETIADRDTKAKAGEEPDFIVTEFFKNWMGKNHFIPLTAYKAMRLTENDIPEQYKGSALQYLFAVPSK